jgi:putative acetyltransferase
MVPRNMRGPWVILRGHCLHIAIRPSHPYREYMHIRRLVAQDAHALATLVHASVHAIGARDYTATQLSVWSAQPTPPDRFLESVSDGRDVFVAISDDDVPVGFIDLESNGHIDHFYCHPDVAGTGVGAMLYDHLEKIAVARGLSMLFVEASEAAKRFFGKHGYRTIQRRDFTLHGVDIHNYLMRKSLDDQLDDN